MPKRVVWDMTFAHKSLTGTRVYARNVFDALAKLGSFELCETSAGATMRAEKTGNVLTGLQNIWWLQTQLPRMLRTQNADLIHASAYLGPLWAPCPMVVNVLDTTYLEFRGDFDWKWRLYARLLIPPTIKRAAALITLSNDARQKIARTYNVSNQKIRVIYPGVSTEFHSSTDMGTIAETRARYGLQDEYVLFVGAQEKRKNIPALVGALGRARAEFPSLTLALSGPRGSGSAALASATNELGLKNAVLDLGMVPQQDLPILYAGASAFVYASKLEGFGIPPVEAMACGTPVISAPNPPLPEVLGDAALFTENDSPDALAKGILRVLGNAELARRLRESGLKRAQQLTWERASHETATLYQEILRG